MLWWQMSLRALIVFLFGLVLIRLLGRRAFGKQTPLDIVLAIVIGSNLSRALTGNAPLVPTLAATAVLALCYWLLDHAAARWHRFGRLVKGDPIWLGREGKLDRQQMRQAGVSPGDIKEAARQSGLADLSGVQEVVLERSGKISTVRRDRSRG